MVLLIRKPRIIIGAAAGQFAPLGGLAAGVFEPPASAVSGAAAGTFAPLAGLSSGSSGVVTPPGSNPTADYKFLAHTDGKFYHPDGQQFFPRGVCAYPNQAGFSTYLKSNCWAFNLIRIFYSPASFTQAQLNTLVDTYTALGIVVVISWDRTGAYGEDDVAARTAFYTLNATRNKDNSFVWYEPYNEPGNQTTDVEFVSGQWRFKPAAITSLVNLMRGAITTIRAAGATAPIICSSGGIGMDVLIDTSFNQQFVGGIDNWSMMMQAFPAIISGNSNIAMSVHLYENYSGTSVASPATTVRLSFLQQFVDAALTRGYPLFFGEYGSFGVNAGAIQSARNMDSLRPNRHFGDCVFQLSDSDFNKLTTAGGTGGAETISTCAAPANRSELGLIAWNGAHNIPVHYGFNLPFISINKHTTVGNTYNLVDFGVTAVEDGGGAVNNRTPIQNALNAVKATGGKLTFPANKTYIVGSNGTSPTLEFVDVSNVEILGNGSTLKAANGASTVSNFPIIHGLRANDIVVNKLHIDGNRANRVEAVDVNSHNWRFENSHRLVFLECDSDNCPAQDGFGFITFVPEPDVTKYNSDVLLYKCRARNNHRIGAFWNCGNNFQVRGGTYSDIPASGQPVSAIDIEPDSGHTNPRWSNILILGVTFGNTSCPSLSFVNAINGAVGTATRATVQGCLFKGGFVGAFASPSWVAINFVGEFLYGNQNEFQDFNGVAYQSIRGLINFQGGASLSQPVANVLYNRNCHNDVNVATATIYDHSVSSPGPGFIRDNKHFNNADTLVFIGNANWSQSNNLAFGSAQHTTPACPWPV